MRAISLLLGVAALQAQDSLSKGISAFDRGHYAEAREELRQAPKDDPRARLFLALTSAATGDCPAASPVLLPQFRSQTDPRLKRLAGIAYVQCASARNQPEQAYLVLQQLQRDLPDDADVLYLAARIHMKAWNDAVYQMFQKTPGSFRVNQISAEVFETQGRYPEAVGEYRKAIEKSPSVINLHYRLGRALLLESHDEKQLNEAREQFEAELRINPSDAAAEYQVAQILAAQQKPQEAQERYRRALSLSPDFAEALVALGKLQVESRQPAAAIPLLERATELQPSSEAAHYSLMLAYRNAGRSADAQKEKEVLDRLLRPPEGEFSEFLKKLGEKAPKQ